MKRFVGVLVAAGVLVFGTFSSSIAASEHPPGYAYTAPNPPLITDAPSAIRIARAMMLAMHKDPRNLSESDWEQNCKASLIDGVWVITDRAPHAPRIGYFTGAAAIYIGAQDGRYLEKFFVD
jgi:hypothetical protein